MIWNTLPSLCPNLLDKARDGFDLVYAVYPERTHTGWRNLTSALGRWMFRIAIPNLNYDYSSYRLDPDATLRRRWPNSIRLSLSSTGIWPG